MAAVMARAPSGRSRTRLRTLEINRGWSRARESDSVSMPASLSASEARLARSVAVR